MSDTDEKIVSYDNDLKEVKKRIREQYKTVQQVLDGKKRSSVGIRRFRDKLKDSKDGINSMLMELIEIFFSNVTK